MQILVAACAGLLVLGCNQSDAPFENLVLVTIDTLRADHLGSYGYPRPTSPFLDSLAAGGLRFERVIASSSHTAPSHASIFTSQYPARHQVVTNGIVMQPSVPNIAGLLAGEGFETAAVTATGFLRSISNDFDTVMAPEARRYVSHWSARNVTDRAIEWLSERHGESRFFLWVHYYDVHMSYPPLKIRPDFMRQVQADGVWTGPALREALRKIHYQPESRLSARRGQINRYDALIAYVDSEIGRLYRAAQLDTSSSRTLWVITADHGEGLGDHKYIGHGEHLYTEQLRVPLIMNCGDDWQSGHVVKRLVRHVDLLPTLTELLEVPTAIDDLDLEGVSLMPLVRNDQSPVPIRFAFAQRRPTDETRVKRGWSKELVLAAESATHKLIMHEDSGNEFYDLRADPFEVENLASQGGEEYERTVEWLRRKYKFMVEQPLPGTSGDVQMDPKYVEELKALGYLQ